MFVEDGHKYILLIYLIGDKNFRIEVHGVTKHLQIIRELSEKESIYFIGAVEQLADDILVSIEMKKIVIKKKEIKRTDPYEDFKDDAEAFDDMDFSHSQNPVNEDSNRNTKIGFEDDDDLDSSSMEDDNYRKTTSKDHKSISNSQNEENSEE